MRSPGAIARLPYAVSVTYAPHGQAPCHHVLHYRKRLRTALEECRRASVAWAGLCGGQYPVLFWTVLDCRDGTRHTSFSPPEGGASDGTQGNTGTRLF